MSQIQIFGPSSGGSFGDVTGPASSTDNAVVRFDGTTGKIIQNSNATLSDAGVLSLALPLPVGSGGLGITSTPTNGQIPIGNGSTYTAATITSTGGTITVTNGAGSINLESVATGITWNSVAGTSQALVKLNGYINANAAATSFSLPVTAAVGDSYRIAGYGAGGWTITQNAGQSIYLGNLTTTVGVGGSLASTNAHDCVEIICVVANNEFQVISSMGNITVV